jgi:hypothetical protein
MAVSAVGLANMALTLIGEEPILAFTEDNKPARFVCQHYDNVRQYVLRQHPWGCATTRATLAVLATAPEWGFSTAHELPSDYMRLVERELHKTDYRIEDGVLMSDNGTEKISYVYDLEDVSKMDPLLQQTMAAFLAAELAIPVTQSKDLSRQLFGLYKEKLAEAQHTDVVEAPIDVVTEDSWIDARHRGTEQQGAKVTVP